jgi:ribA/ribD-fused uncharacterized protein
MERRVMICIERFEGEYRWLSNFAPALVDSMAFLTRRVEHAYQAAKTMDGIERMRIAAAPTPGRARRLGRSVALPADWDELKLGVMLDLLRQKFHLSEYRSKLLATGDAVLIEGNPWGDTYWGVCRGVGENQLGKLLMQVRRELVSVEV